MISADEPLVLDVAEQHIEEYAVIVPSGTPHQVLSVNEDVFLLLIEPHGP